MIIKCDHFVFPGWHLREGERSWPAGQLYWSSEAPGVRVLQLQCRGDILTQTEVYIVPPASLDEEKFRFPLQFWTKHVVEPPEGLEIRMARVSRVVRPENIVLQVQLQTVRRDDPAVRAAMGGDTDDHHVWK